MLAENSENSSAKTNPMDSLIGTSNKKYPDYIT
jgi:hypothetical protein